MKSFAAILLAAAAAAPAAAQPGLQPSPVIAEVPAHTLLTVSAQGETRLAPDIARVSAGVVTQAATANAALAENRARMQRVVAALRAAGIERADIQTSQLSLNPNYRYQENREPVIAGYQAQNTVSVTLRDLEDAGAVLDALVAEGANQLNGPNFEIEDEEAALNAARRDAMAQARQRADLYASAAGLSVARIVSITEGAQHYPRPPMPMAVRAEAADASSPIEPGRLQLTANVTVVYELR